MESAAISIIEVVADSTLKVEPSSPVDEPSLATLPASRPAVDARGLALAILAVLALIFALSWARAFVIPLLLGVVISYTLSPLVSWLEAIRVPRMVATFIVMIGMLGAIAFGVYSLRGQMQTIVEQLPEAAAKLSTGLAALQLTQAGDMQKMQNAAT
jgi:predicted PurR-regulated permease PerM